MNDEQKIKAAEMIRQWGLATLELDAMPAYIIGIRPDGSHVVVGLNSPPEAVRETLQAVIDDIDDGEYDHRQKPMTDDF